MNLDLIAAIGCFWLALIVFVLHVVSSPRRKSWMTIPEYVRTGFVVTGAMFLWRAANFASLKPAALGHANAEAVMAEVALVYTVTALAVWVVRARLANQGWSRLEWLRGVMERRPDIVPAPLTLAQVTDELIAQGALVATPPADGPGAGADPGC